MNHKYHLLLPLGFPLMLCLCYHGAVKNDRLAYVGSTLVTQQDADAFGTAARFYPTPPEEFSLGTRPTVSALVETEAIYRHEHGTLGSFSCSIVSVGNGRNVIIPLFYSSRKSSSRI